MRRYNFGATILGTVAAACIAMVSGDASAEVKPGLPATSAEFISTPAHIISVATSGAPMNIWETLEHGERVECGECIPVVAPLLYNENAQNREIAAWWLRRRIFGVFGPNEVYEQTLNTLAHDANETRRAYAASAIGEFLLGAGVPAVAQALTHDASPLVRTYAAKALGRLNDDGGGALGQAMADTDAGVKVAALTAAGRINSFTDEVAATKALADKSPDVRRRAVMLLGDMRASDTAASVLTLAQKDSDAQVRAEACHALGVFGDGSVLGALTKIAQTDPNSFVVDMANIAIKEL